MALATWLKEQGTGRSVNVGQWMRRAATRVNQQVATATGEWWIYWVLQSCNTVHLQVLRYRARVPDSELNWRGWDRALTGYATFYIVQLCLCINLNSPPIYDVTQFNITRIASYLIIEYLTLWVCGKAAGLKYCSGALPYLYVAHSTGVQLLTEPV